ncbi:hypothetical protein [Haladaptatus cibarius]|uniref:hypothetical protein n=1 Tax=Haladaptatus cibarius TaxID=453847 RepID=UPI001B7FF2DF|nr:hypothetical protein [Haladaptatus cibarius]
MSGNEKFDRRSIIKNIGFGAVLTTLGATSVSSAAYGDETISLAEFKSEPLSQNTGEILFGSNGNAFCTTSILGDGFQMYRVSGVYSESDSPDQVVTWTAADHGVHNLSWKDSDTIQFSMDGATYEGYVGPMPESSDPIVQNDVSKESSDFTKISDEPLLVDYKGNGVACGMGWCVRIDSDDYGSLLCETNICRGPTTVPPMNHGHFAVYKSGNYNGSGFNLWAGHHQNCVWAGEENKSRICCDVCGPENGLPSISALVDLYEDVIDRAAAAGVAIPSFVVIALAYYLAASTLAPPTGVPLV